MSVGAVLGLAWTVLSRGVLGRGFSDTADRLMDKVAALRDARSEVEKAEIEREIVALKAVADLQKPSSRRWWSAMMLGQYLIVLPFGLWWAAVFFVSVFDVPFVVKDVPEHLFDMATWLIPAIVVGTLIERGR